MGFIDHEHPSLLLPLSISIALHLLLFFLSVTIPAHMPKEQKQTIIEVWPTSPEEIEEMANAKGAMRIADIDEPAVQKRPKKAKFVGMYNSSVGEETVSRHSGKGRGSGPGTNKGKGQGVRGGRSSKEKLLDFNRDLFAMREPSSATTVTRSIDSSGSIGRISVGGSGGGDFFPDVKLGDHTYLNVLRYPDVSYFVRLKRVFRTTFNPVPSLRNYFMSNQVARGSVEVVMAVAVDKTGGLSELFVLRSSGIPGYDQEAMRTVRASSPFSKPPDKFLAKDDTLRMMWTFTVYL